MTKVWNVVVEEGPSQIGLTPEYDLNLMGQDHTVIATVTNSTNDTQENVLVTFTIREGPNEGVNGTDTTNSTGQASFTYPGTGGVGTDKIQACFTDDADTICSNVVDKEWTTETIALTPLLATNPVGTSHTVNATVQDLKGNLLQGILVTFTIRDGPNKGVNGTNSTDVNGLATFTYTDTQGPGTDVIRACFTNANGTEVCTDYGDTFDNDAFKEWQDGDNPVCPPLNPNPPSLPDGYLVAEYDQTLTGFGGTPPYTFTVTQGVLPPGLELSDDGQITGTPQSTGFWEFTITATDANNCTGSRPYSILVLAEIPTLTEWGVLVMALLMAGTVLLYRRRA